MTSREPTAQRFKRIAYVCEGAVIHRVDDEGFSTFSRVFRDNPDGCRWVVVWTVGEYRVYDIFDALMGERADVFLPGRYHAFTTEDAAMTAAVMLPATSS
jgi:hypothetical protein